MTAIVAPPARSRTEDAKLARRAAILAAARRVLAPRRPPRRHQASRRRSQPLAQMLRAGMKGGTVRRDDPDLLARMINGLVSYSIHECYVLGEGQDAGAGE